MIIDSNDFGEDASSVWDVVVVGAGAVGIYIAILLGRSGRRVLLLESGGPSLSIEGKELNTVVQTGRHHSGATDGRARVLGGTTTLWGGQLTQFSDLDFRFRKKNSPEWLVDFDEISHHYRSVAANLNLDISRLEDTTLFSVFGLKNNLKSDNCELFFTRWLRESNFSRLFGEELRQSNNISILLNAQTRGFVSVASRITGVEVQVNSGQKVIFKCNSLILANGTIEISRLLLLSSKNNNNLPWASNKNIGRYFQDHIDVEIGSIKSDARGKILEVFENRVYGGYKYQPKLKFSKAKLRDATDLNVACSLRFNSSIAEDLSAIKVLIKSLMNGRISGIDHRVLFHAISISRIWWPLIWRYLRHRRIMAMADRGIEVIAHCEQLPDFDSRISLDETKLDRFGDPLAQINWLVDDSAQMKVIRDFAITAEKYLKEQCGATLQIANRLLENDKSYMELGRDSYHQCGGACMGSSAEVGVVDSECRIHNSENVYVAGAAVFPYSSFANPTFTALALANRLVNHLNN